MNLRLASLSVRLPVAIAALVTAVATGISTFDYQSARRGFEGAAANSLAQALDAHSGRLVSWLQSVESDLTTLQHSPDLLASAGRFRSDWQALGPQAGETLQTLYAANNPYPVGERQKMIRADDGSAYSATHAAFHPFITGLVTAKGYYDAFLIDPAGHVLYTMAKEADFGADILAGPLKDSGLGAAFAKAMASPDGSPVFADFTAYSPSAGAAAAFAAIRVDGADNRPLGVLAFQLPNDRFNAILNDVVGLGETGHLTMFGADLLLRNDSRFEGEPGFLTPAEGTPEQKAALDGSSGLVSNAKGEDGNDVIIAYQPIDFLDVRWGLTAEQDKTELLAVAADLRRSGMLALAGAGLTAILLGLLLGRSISVPLTAIGAAMDRVKSGNYAAPIPYIGKRDEVGAIAQNLATFSASLAAADEAARMTIFKGFAFSVSDAAMMLVDRDLNILDYNDTLKTLFNNNIDAIRDFWPDFDPENLLGEKIDRFHRHPEHQRRLLADPANLPFQADIRLGEARIALYIAAIMDGEGNYVGCSLQWKDVREERVNKSIIDVIRRNQVMIEYDTNFNVVKTNETFSRVFGYTEDVGGRSFESLFGPNEDTRIQMERLRKGLPVTRKVKRARKDGSEIWVEIVMNPIQDRSGKLDSIVEVGTDVTELELIRSRAEAEKEANAEILQKVVGDLRDGLSGLADGDLTHLIRSDFAPAYEELRTNFNAALTQLTDIVVNISAATGQISSGTAEITQAADDLSRRTENQAAALEQTAAALEELTASVQAASDAAVNADRAVQQARENAEASGRVVIEAVQAMGEIEKSSQQISKIIGVIEDIAFQTNLLALNAGVEAARAGETGRGFAVVASEVRALAQRSSDAAREIGQLISASSGQVERGVTLVGQTGDALQKIVASVAGISNMVSEIAGSSREQSKGLSEINASVTEMDQVTQQNAAMVEQSTAASYSLRQQAEHLSQMIDRFRIEADDADDLNVIALPPARQPRVRPGQGEDADPRFSRRPAV